MKRNGVACERLSEKLAYENSHYREQLRERKDYFFENTGYRVWQKLIERDFQKRFFMKWAEHEQEAFCGGCDRRNNCYINEV